MIQLKKNADSLRKEALGVNKIIWKSILATLVATLLLCSAAVFACVCFFPPTVMELSYNVGWDRTAMRYAEKSYERFGESYYAAFAMEIAVSEGMDEETEKYAAALVDCKDFNEFCVNGGISGEGFGTYRQYAYSTLCLAKYRLGKGEEAVEIAAESLNGKFPPNNSLAAVYLYALKDGETGVAEKAKEKLSAIDEAKLSEADRAYLSNIKNLVAAEG